MAIKTIKTVAGDLWDSVSDRAYGDCMYAGLIMEANTTHLHTYRFNAGVVLDIPDLPEPASIDENKLPPWKRSGK